MVQLYHNGNTHSNSLLFKMNYTRAFDFGDMEYFVGIKLFNRVIDKLGVNLAHQDRYELFDRIYEEGVREKKDKNYMEGIEIPPNDVSSIEIPK